MRRRSLKTNGLERGVLLSQGTLDAERILLGIAFCHGKPDPIPFRLALFIAGKAVQDGDTANPSRGHK